MTENTQTIEQRYADIINHAESSLEKAKKDLNKSMLDSVVLLNRFQTMLEMGTPFAEDEELEIAIMISERLQANCDLVKVATLMAAETRRVGKLFGVGK